MANRPYAIVGAYAPVCYRGPMMRMMVDCVRATEREAREAASNPALGHPETWKQLYRQGWRIVTVVVHD